MEVLGETASRLRRTVKFYAKVTRKMMRAQAHLRVSRGRSESEALIISV